MKRHYEFLDGAHGVYAHRRSAVRAAQRRGTVVVDSWPVSDPPPSNSDGRAWDEWRARRGYAGSR